MKGSDKVANLNRDYLVTLDVKTSVITLPSPLVFYVTDRKTMNIFVKLIINMSTNPLLKNYVSLENASDYRCELALVAPNKQVFHLTGELLNEEEALFSFNLSEEQIGRIGEWTCEIRVYSMVNSNEETVTSRSFIYTVNKSITTDLDDAVLDSTQYGIIEDLVTRIERLEQRVFNNE